MKTTKRQIQYNIEHHISRIPGLFPYIEDGESHKATDSPMGCYGKCVCDLRLPCRNENDKYGINNGIKVPKIQEDEYGKLVFEIRHYENNLTKTLSIPIWSEEEHAIIGIENVYYSYRTIINLYHKYKVVKDIYNNKLFQRNEYGSTDYTRIQEILKFINFVERGIGCYTVEELVDEYNNDEKNKQNPIVFDYEESYLIPSKIYIATAADLYNQMKYLQTSCEYYNSITNAEDKKIYNELCCECEQYKLKGGENMVNLLKFCIDKAEEVAEYYYSYTNHQSYYNINIPLHLTMLDMGVYDTYQPIWDSTQGYRKGEVVNYNNESYICIGSQNPSCGIIYIQDDEKNNIYYGYVNKYDCIEFPTEIFTKIKDLEQTHIISEGGRYIDNDIKLKNVQGGQKFNVEEEEAKGDIVDSYSFNANTSSRLKDLRRMKNFIENNKEYKPADDKDWLFYYRKGVVTNKKLTDRLGNLEKIDETITDEHYKELFGKTNHTDVDKDLMEEYKCNFYIYGNSIDDISCQLNEEVNRWEIVFKYTINAHLKPETITMDEDEEGNILLYYRNLIKDEKSDNGKYHGITYTEAYEVEMDENEGSLWSLINGNEYLTIPKGVIVKGINKDGNTYNFIVGEDIFLEKWFNYDENDFCKIKYKFEDYVNGGTFTVTDNQKTVECVIPDNKRYEFSTLAKQTDYNISTGQGTTVIKDIVSEYNVKVENKVDYLYNNLYKEDYLMGVHYQPYVKENVYIDRGNADAYESYLKLMEINTMQDLENYQNGGFFKIEKMQ